MKAFGYEITKVIPEPIKENADVYKSKARKYSDVQESMLVLIFIFLFITFGCLVAFTFDSIEGIITPPSGIATLLFAAILTIEVIVYYYSKAMESYWFKMYWKAAYPDQGGK